MTYVGKEEQKVDDVHHAIAVEVFNASLMPTLFATAKGSEKLKNVNNIDRAVIVDVAVTWRFVYIDAVVPTKRLVL